MVILFPSYSQALNPTSYIKLSPGLVGIKNYSHFADCPNGFVHIYNRCYKWMPPNTIDQHLKNCHLYRGQLLQVSISPTIYLSYFCNFATFLYLKLVFTLFCKRTLTEKLLIKRWWIWLEVSFLTTICFFFVNFQKP